MKKEMTCIVCPVGCQLTVEHDKNNENVLVSGNKCRRGKEYAIKELKNPTRMIPTTVVIENAEITRLPVRTKNPVPKELIFRCMEEINRIRVKAPVKMGDIIIKDILNTGVDVIATKSVHALK